MVGLYLLFGLGSTLNMIKKLLSEILGQQRATIRRDSSNAHTCPCVVSHFVCSNAALNLCGAF